MAWEKRVKTWIFILFSSTFQGSLLWSGEENYFWESGNEDCSYWYNVTVEEEDDEDDDDVE